MSKSNLGIRIMAALMALGLGIILLPLLPIGLAMLTFNEFEAWEES